MTGRLRNMTSIYISRGDSMLLLYRIGSRVVAPSWCGIGGHFENNELNDAGACVLRELEEETGLTANDLTGLRLRYITLRLKNGEVRQNYYFFADLKPGTAVNSACTEGILEWAAYDDIMERNMPHTARYVLEHYLTKGKDTRTLYGGIAEENGVVFTELNEF